MDDTDNSAEVLEPEDVETPEDDFEAFEEQAEADDDDQDEADTPEEESADPVEDGLEDVEIDGKTYKVPKDAALRQADYTRKTQEVAEARKEVEATLERLQTVSKEETQALANVAIVNAELAGYENVDWDAWDQTNPQEAARHWRRYTQLKDAGAAAVNAYTEAQQRAQLAAQQETAKRLESGAKVLAEKIPGWGADKANAILDFGVKTYGFDPDELKAIDNPLAILVLHDAMEHRKSKQQATTKAKIEQQQAVKPVTTLRGNSGRTTVSPATKDFAAFEKLANKGR